MVILVVTVSIITAVSICCLNLRAQFRRRERQRCLLMLKAHHLPRLQKHTPDEPAYLLNVIERARDRHRFSDEELGISADKLTAHALISLRERISSLEAELMKDPENSAVSDRRKNELLCATMDYVRLSQRLIDKDACPEYALTRATRMALS